MEPFDPTKPNIARVWDYWLGGKNNFKIDRELAQKMLEIHPISAQMARENRQFLGRAVRYVAARGIRQFIDVGTDRHGRAHLRDTLRGPAMPVRCWYGDDPTPGAESRTATFLGGVARKP